MTRLLQANDHAFEGLLAELLEAERLLDDPVNVGKRLAFGRKSKGTRRGDVGHYDVDVAVLDEHGAMEVAVQVYRSRAADIGDAISGGIRKAMEQLDAAPARTKRLVVVLAEGTIEDAAPFLSRIVSPVIESGIEFELVGVDGRRALIRESL